jgi:hypothetical protein
MHTTYQIAVSMLGTHERTEFDLWNGPFSCGTHTKRPLGVATAKQEPARWLARSP